MLTDPSFQTAPRALDHSIRQKMRVVILASVPVLELELLRDVAN